MTDSNKQTVSIEIGTTIMQICRTLFLMLLQSLLTMHCSHIAMTKANFYY